MAACDIRLQDNRTCTTNDFLHLPLRHYVFFLHFEAVYGESVLEPDKLTAEHFLVDTLTTYLDGSMRGSSQVGRQPSIVANRACGQLTGKMQFPCPRSRLRIWYRELGSVVPSPGSPLIPHTQAKPGAYLQDFASRYGFH